MKVNRIFISTLIGLILTGSGIVLAQETDMPGENVDSGRKGKLMRMDADGDGKISLEEYLTGAEQRFGKMDADADGFLTAEEYKAKRKAMRAQSRERRHGSDQQEGQEEN